MSDKPEALRLADILEKMPLGECDEQAAAELRRLHAELERKSDAIQRLWKERDELRTLNAELVEALRPVVEVWFRPHGINYVDFRPYMETARAALAKVGASNGS